MGVFSLTGWARLIRAEFLVLRVTQDNTMSSLASYKGLSPAMAERSSSFYSQSKYKYIMLLLPHDCIATTVVWAFPRSLATTKGII